MPTKRTLETVPSAPLRRSVRRDLKKEAIIKVENSTFEATGKVEIAPKREPLIKLEFEDEPLIKVEYEEATSLKVETDSSTVKEESNPRPNDFPLVSPKDVTDAQPKRWNDIYNEVVKMRGLITTPVDTMGCERMPDSITPQISKTDRKAYRFQLLVSLMLSSQTKDEVNYAALVALKSHFVSKGFPGLCLEAILEATEAEIDQCICKVGFHRRKAGYIKKACELLRDKFDGDIPKTIEDIVSLPGVGPKMGHLLLQNGWKINSGIGVDVHLHRLAQMWNWVPKSDKPETTRAGLEDWLPKRYWADINPLLVGFGQTVCVPKANNCDICFLATKGLCRGVNRKLANTPLTEQRIAKLGKQRGDLSALVALRTMNDM